MPESEALRALIHTCDDYIEGLEDMRAEATYLQELHGYSRLAAVAAPPVDLSAIIAERISAAHAVRAGYLRSYRASVKGSRPAV